MISFIRGFKTSEFWLVLGTVLNLIVEQYTSRIEAATQAAGDAAVGAVPESTWLAIAAAVMAALWAVVRGLQKSKLMTAGNGGGTS